MSGAVDVVAVLRRTADGLQGVADACTNSDLAITMGTRAQEMRDVTTIVAELIETGARMLPRNVCLGNTNVSDRTKLPLVATMGELREFAAALASAGGTK